MASKGNLLERGNRPLLNMSAVDNDQFLHRHNMNLNNAILTEEHHLPTHDQMASECNTRGTAQNKIKASQWMLQNLRSINVMGYSGEDRSSKEKKKNVKALNALYYEDETDPIGTCEASVVGGERPLITNLPATSYHKSDHPNISNNWKFGESPIPNPVLFEISTWDSRGIEGRNQRGTQEAKLFIKMEQNY